MRTLRGAAVLVVLCLALSGQDVPVAEPHQTGVFFYLDSDTEGLINLERVIAKEVTRSKSRFGGATETVFTMPGAKSTVRLADNKPGVFVFAVEPGINPAHMVQMFRVESKANTREVLWSQSSGGRTASAFNKSMTPFRISRHGNLSFKLTLTDGPLMAGEYCLSWTNSQVGYCFGVDVK
jgi:hypothetical protein